MWDIIISWLVKIRGLYYIQSKWNMTHQFNDFNIYIYTYNKMSNFGYLTNVGYIKLGCIWYEIKIYVR